MIRLFRAIFSTFIAVYYPSAEKQSVYSAVPVDWATEIYVK